MADFDERSGIVSCKTPWGLWYQTLDEVSLEIPLASTVHCRMVLVESSKRFFKVVICDETLIQGELFNSIVPSGTIWTLESDKEGKLLRIVLEKQDTSSANTWISLLKDKYVAEPWLLDNMRKKAAIERMQLENPGFDLSGANVTGDYATGGPEIPS